MRTQERQQYLMKVAQKDGFVSISKTAEKFGVSVETIRRDINELCRKNQLKKVHGGAAPIKSPIWRDSSFAARTQQITPAKVAICQEAAKLIREFDVIALDCGATTECLASCLKDIKHVTFVVNSLRVATILADKVNSGEIEATVIMASGQIITPTYRSHTMAALETIDKYHYSRVFTSATGLTASGASASGINLGNYVQHMMRRADSCVLVLESYKLGKHSFSDFAKLTDFDQIITDNQNPCPQEILDALADTKTVFTVVDCESHGK